MPKEQRRVLTQNEKSEDTGSGFTSSQNIKNIILSANQFCKNVNLRRP